MCSRLLVSTLAAWLLALAVCGAAAPGAVAQTIRLPSMEVYTDRVPLARFIREADDQGRNDWPNPPERGGTRVMVLVNSRRASMVLVTPHAYGRERLLAVTQSLVRDLRLPVSDIYSYQGRRTVGAEMDLTTAIRRARLRVACNLDLGRIAAALLRTNLPRPIVFGVDAWNGSTASVGHGASAHALGEDVWFARATDLRLADTLHFESVGTWSGLLAGLFVYLLPPLFAAGMPWYIALRKRPEPAVRDPEEVQRRYDRRPGASALLLLVFLPLGALLAAEMPEAVRSMDAVLPIAPRAMWHGVSVVFPFSWLACWLVMSRLRPAPAGEAADGASLFPEENTGAALARGLFLLMLPMLLLLAALPLGLHPLVVYVATHDPEWRSTTLAALHALKALPLFALCLGVWLATRGNVKTVKSGPWRRMVDEMAERAEVRVRKVVLVRGKLANAFANAFGIVGMTQGLLEKLEPDEVRAIVAHELAHLKGGHPRKTLFVLLPTIALLWVAFHFARPLLDRLPDSGFTTGLILIVVVVAFSIIPALVSGRGQREREREADALAVEWTGDPELVIRALTKLHTLAGTPGRLKPSDEFLSTHPSLAHRIEAIRARASGGPAPAPPRT